MKKHVWIVGACVALGLATTACGSTAPTAAGPGTTSAPTTTAPPPTTTTAPPSTTGTSAPASGPATGPKADFIKQADAICTDLAKQTSALAIDLKTTATIDNTKQADAIDQSVAISQKGLDQLKALAPPPGDESTVTGFWDGIAQQIDVQKQVGAAVRANDLQTASTLTQQTKAAGTQLNAQLAAYGFVACAR